MNLETTVRNVMMHDGMKCYYEHWLPNSARALFVIVHGLGRYSSNYRSLINELIKDGYAVAIYDQRGFGRSGGTRGDVRSFKMWVDDLDQFIKFSKESFAHEVPLILVGEGLGASLSIYYLAERIGKASAFVALEGPMHQAIELPWWKEKFPQKIIEHLPILPTECVKSDDSLSVGKLSLRTVKQLKILRDSIGPMSYRLQIPVLIMCGGGERSTVQNGCRDFYLGMQQAQKKIITYAADRLDFSDETLSSKVVKDINQWLKSVLSDGKA